MRSVIPFKIISDGVSGLIPMTDTWGQIFVLICIEQKLHRYGGLSRGWYFEYQDRCFFWQHFLVEPPVANHIPNTQMKKFLMKILSDESRILRLSPNLYYGVVKISSGTLQDKQAGVLIIKLKG